MIADGSRIGFGRNDMPYVIRKVGNEWCLFHKDTGEKKGCSESKEKAIAYMRASYAHEHDKSKGK